ncbi:MAG: S41 family peptidase [Planctomycetota bacterium]
MTASRWIALAGGVFSLCASVHAGDVDLPREPALSADGSIIAFTWAGDIWAVASDGGVANRLTSHPADEQRSAFSPDGSSLVFESNRDGARNLYSVELSGEPPALIAGEVRRITEWDRSQALSAFTRDGEGVLFSGRVEPSVFRHERMYTAPLDGSTIERVTDAFGLMPTPMRDGGVLFTRGRMLNTRPTYQGPASTDIFSMDEAGNFTQLTTHNASDYAAYELADGSVAFVSSRDGQNNVYKLRAGATDADAGAVTQLTRFAPGDEVSIGHGVQSFTVSADGSTAAFVVWDTLYTLDLTAASAQPRAVQITASADDDVPDQNVINVSSSASEMAWHPSGDVVAIASRGEIWLRATADDQPTRRITTTPAREHDLVWSPDGAVLYFASDDEQSLGSIHAASVGLTREDLAGFEPDEEDESKDESDENADDTGDKETTADAEATEGTDDEDATDEADDDGESDEDKPKPIDHGKRWADALTFEISPVVEGTTWDHSPTPSPDGSSLLFVRGLGDLMLLDLDSGETTTVFEGWDEPDVQWLADSRHIVYERQDLDYNSDIWLLDVLGGGIETATNLTRHPDIDTSPRVSADGKVLVFLSDRAGENWNYDVHRIYLDAALEDMTDYELAEYFDEASKAAGKRKPLDKTDEDRDEVEPFEFDADDAWLRVRRITTLSGSEGNLALTPGGDRIVFSSSWDGDARLYSVKYDGSDRKTVQSGSTSDVTPSLNGKAITFVQSGQVKTASPTGSSRETYPISAEVRISRRAEQRQKFLEGARTFGETFYNMKGLDWDALTSRYLTLAERARTSTEFNAVFRMLLGEVDGSHTGISGGGGFSTTGAATGYLGIDIEPDGVGYRVTRVLDDGPSAKDEAGLLTGDVITAINGQPLSRNSFLRDFNAAMTSTSGDETLLTITRDGSEAFVLVTPHSYGTENNLRYRDEVLQRRDEVARLSGGRLGYLHIRGMSLPSVRDFERDLYAAAKGREGLVIDVRDNGGGFTTDILLASLTAPRHAYTIPRGANPADVQPDDYPRDRRLIYGWTRPINVLMNQNSFSNAEIFSHSIKTSGRGRLVGTKTFGGVISTGGFRLIDGTFIRRPFRGWYLPDGRDMDVHGAEPDVAVAQTPGSEAAGRDPQLEAAVRDLLDQIDTGKDSRAIRP